MLTIDVAGALAILKSIAATMEENKTRLVELDQVIGDGDLGLTMSKGFREAAADAEKFTETDPGKFLMKAGMAINRHAPSTMGTIMATGFMRGGKAVGGGNALDSAGVAAFFQAFLEGVMERGKAKPGDKTAVDVLFPAAEAAAGAAGLPLPEMMGKVVLAARQGNEDAKKLMNLHGRAAIFREKTIGLEDPGCAAAVLMIEAFAKAVG